MIKPVKIKVRYRDCDMMGHVNNAVYLNYFEQTRIHYFQSLLGKEWDYQTQGMVLVKNEVTYLSPILLNDEPEIHMKLVAVGTKSFTLSYELFVNQNLYSTGISKLVCINTKTGKSVEVFPELREGLSSLEKKI